MGIHQGDFLDRGITGIEQDRGPTGTVQGLRKLPDTASTKIGSGTRRWMKLSPLDFFLVNDSLDQLATLQRIEEPLFWTDVMVLKIHQFHAWVAPATAFSFHVGFDQVSLRHPVQ